MSDESLSCEPLQERLARAEAELSSLRPLAHPAAAQQRTASALDSISEGFVILDHDGRFVFVNPAAERFLQKSRAEFLGRSLWELFPEAGSRRFGLEYRRAVAENVPVHFEEFYPEPLNAWYEVRAYPSAEGLSVFFRDITERKLADTYREMGREVLQLLNEAGELRVSIQRALAALRTRTGFDAVSIRLQEGDDFPYYVREGYPEDSLRTGHTLIECGADGGMRRDKGDSVGLACTCGLVMSGKTDPASPLFTPGGSFWTNDSCRLPDIPPGEDPRLHPRNQCIDYGYASVALVPIRNKDRIAGLIQLNDRRKGRFTLERVELLEGIGSHIGAALMRKQAEAALRAGDERHRAILQTAMDGFWLVDIQGHLLEVNETYCRMSGYSAQELLAMRIPDLEAAEARDETAAHIQAVMAQGEDRFESRHRRKDGSTFDVEVSVQYRPTEGGRFVGFLRDVTERTRVEQELERARSEAVTEQQRLEVVTHALSRSEAALQRANDELESANKALRHSNETLEARVATRSADLAHRSSQLQALARELTRAEERERQRVAQVIHDQLQQLLSVARIRLGMALGQVGTGSVHEHLSEVDDLIAESLDITRSLTAELSPAILRRSGLVAALRWLGRSYEARFALTVAVEAEEDVDVDEETRVTLFRSVRELLFNVVKHARVASARVRVGREADGCVRILVSDDGVGFDPEAVRAQEGTGGSFGLFRLRERLEFLGGHLRTDSAPGRGASFTILAPLAQSVGPEASAPAAASTAPLAIAVRRRTRTRHTPAGRKKRSV